MATPKLKTSVTGTTLAMAVAGLVGCAANGGDSAKDSSLLAAAGKTDLVHCSGVNVCKGHNDCSGASNSCAGQGSCNGTGFVGMPSKACADIGGEVKDSWTGEICTADLIHCNDVNICKGHNDCGGAANSCAGQGSCKGTGFVAMPAKACADVGGKVDS